MDEMLSCSRSTVWAMVKAGTLPPPMRLPGTNRCVRWSRMAIEETVEKWLMPEAE